MSLSLHPLVASTLARLDRERNRRAQSPMTREEMEAESYDPSPCCSGVATGGTRADCMCDMEAPYAKNH